MALRTQDMGGIQLLDIQDFPGQGTARVGMLNDFMESTGIIEPTPPLKHNWVYPGGPYYKGQWIWDSMFVVDLLSILPNKKKVMRDIFQNDWDFQDRWNATMPE